MTLPSACCNRSRNIFGVCSHLVSLMTHMSLYLELTPSLVQGLQCMFFFLHITVARNQIPGTIDPSVRFVGKLTEVVAMKIQLKLP